MRKQDQLEKLLGGLMGNYVHTAFRKGSEHPDADKVWRAIRDMNPKAWAEVIDWLCWALAESLKQELTIKKESQK